PSEPLRPHALLALEQRTKSIARRHHTQPRDKRIADEDLDARIELQQAGLMQDVPDPGEGPELIGLDAVEQVVPGDHDEADRGDGAARKVDKPSKHDHRRPDHEDHAEDEDVEIEAEAPANPHDRELEHDEPEAARQQKAAEFAGRAPARAIEPSRDARQENEDWRA